MPMRRELYPDDWEQISQRIRFGRAQGRCEKCGVAHGATGARDDHGQWHDLEQINGMNSTQGFMLWHEGYPKIITIVLTTAHLDHNPANNDEANLAAYCQLCHLRYDAPMRAARARQTRLQRQGNVALFEGE